MKRNDQEYVPLYLIPSSGYYEIPPPQPARSCYFTFHEKVRAVEDLESYLSSFPNEGVRLFNYIYITPDELLLSDNRGFGIKATMVDQGLIHVHFKEGNNGSESLASKGYYKNYEQQTRIFHNARNFLYGVKAHRGSVHFNDPETPPFIGDKVIGKNSISFSYISPSGIRLLETSISFENGMVIIPKKNDIIIIREVNKEAIRQSTQEVNGVIGAFRNLLFSRNINNNITIEDNSVLLAYGENKVAKFTLEDNKPITLDILNNGKSSKVKLMEYIGPAEAKEMSWRMKFLLTKHITFLPNVHFPNTPLWTSQIEQEDRSAGQKVR